VELHQLQCFIAVLEEGGFKRATARLGITQPALSYQIRRLEEELGVQVLHRGKGGITPTEAGAALLGHAHQVISAVREAHRAVRERAGGVTGEVRMGTVKCVGTYFLPRVLLGLQARHPMVRPRILYRDSDELLEALLAQRLDVAMAIDPPPDARFTHQGVFDEQVSLVSGPGHPFYGRHTVELEELKAVPYVSLSPKTSAGALIHTYLERAGINLIPAITSDDVEAVKKMVEAGMGVSFLPDMATQGDLSVRGSPPRFWRSSVEPTLSLPLVLVTWRDSNHSLALDAFIEEVRRVGRVWDGTGAQPTENQPLRS
jgi:DNA-binding transcriptional LysR family regulator